MTEVDEMTSIYEMGSSSFVWLLLCIMIFFLSAITVNVYSQLPDNLFRGLEDIFTNVFPTGDISFTGPITLFNSSNQLGSPVIANPDNNVYIGWLVKDNHTTRNGSILLTHSSNNGLNFTTPIELEKYFGPDNIIQLAADGTAVHVTWVTSNGTSNTIKIKSSNDSGTNFGQTIDLAPITKFQSPQIALSNHTVYVAWLDEKDGMASLKLVSSSNGGTFSNTVNLFNSTKLLSSPVLSTFGNKVYVAWKDMVPGNDRIYFMASSDGGITFSRPVTIAESSFGIPHLVSSGNNVYVVWQDGDYGNVNLYLKASNDNGSSFADIMPIGQKQGFLEPLVSASDKNLYIAWTDRTFNQSSLKLRTSNDWGATFANNLSSTNGITPGNNPQILSSDNYLYVTWMNASGVFLKESTDSGNNFGDTVEVVRNSPTEVAFFPNTVAAGNNVSIAWKQLYNLREDSAANKILFMNAMMTNSTNLQENR